MTSESVFFRIILMLKPERKIALMLVIANTTIAIISLVEPLLLGKIIDIVSTETSIGLLDNNKLLQMIGLWSFLGMASVFIGIKTILHADQMAQRLRLATIYDFTDHALQLPVSYYDQNPSNRTFNILLEGSLILWNLWFSFFRENCASLVLLVILSPITILMNWRLAIPLILAVFATYIAFAVSLLKAERLQAKADARNSLIMDRVSDLLMNVKLVQAYNHINTELIKVSDKISSYMDIQGPLLKFWSLIVMTNRGASMSALILIFSLGIWLNQSHLATIGEIVGFSAIAQIMLGRLDSVGIFISSAIQQKQKIESLFGILDTETIKDASNKKTSDKIILRGDVVFDRVSFKYPDGTFALKEISFSVERGTITAIVGKSGSGKTTLSNLLTKFYEPTSGVIKIDQIPISEIPNSALRNNIGILFQDPAILERSFEDNVKFGSEAKPWSEIENAMKLASIYEVWQKDTVRQRPPDTNEVAPLLSGGERQRLALARVLLKNPPIIVLDEPTSSIDSITEKEIQKALEHVLENKTAFIIAHRLSTIMNADQIIVMNDGRIIETGTFKDLARNGTYFSKLLKYQIAISESEKYLLTDVKEPKGT